MNKTYYYHFHSFVETPYADPVCVMAINEHMIVIGTMLGRITVFLINEKRSVLLSEISAEHVSGISFESDYVVNVSVGDKEYYKYEFSQSQSGQLVLNNHTKEDIYSSENDHHDKCQTSFLLMGKQKLLIVDLKNKELEEIKSNLSISKTINLQNGICSNYEFEISNYSVPFDFNDKKYLWINYWEESSRTLHIFHFDSLQVFIHSLSHDFGHISHMKLLPNNRLFLVRNNSLCEIREINEEFKVIYSFYNLGKNEIISVDVCLDSSNLEKEGKIVIVLLDIDGNVNVWDNSEITKKFNLYEMKDIKTEFKKKRFFAMNYPYYIKAFKNSFAVSTDFGVFVFMKN